jgi:hypothetical protein
MPHASYTKLKDGTWGVRVAGFPAPYPGQVIDVITKAGARKRETVREIIERHKDTTIASLRPRNKTPFKCACQHCCVPVCRCESYCACRGGVICSCLD